MPGLFLQDRATNSRAAIAQVSLPLTRLIARRSNNRLRRAGRRRRRLDVIQNPRASFAMINLLVPSPPHFLKHVRPHAHSASPAFLLAHFRQRRPAMLPRDAMIMIQQILRHRRDSSSSFRLQHRALFLRNRALRLDLRPLAFRDFFHFLQNFFGSLDPLVVFLAGHHLLQQTVLSVRSLRVRIRRLMLQSFESVVSLNLISLIPVFPPLLFPLLHVQFVSLPVLQGSQMRILRSLQLKTRRRHSRIHFAKFFGNSGKPPANIRKPNIHSLQSKKMLKDRYHETGILTQQLQWVPHAPYLRLGFLTLFVLAMLNPTRAIESISRTRRPRSRTHRHFLPTNFHPHARPPMPQRIFHRRINPRTSNRKRQ